MRGVLELTRQQREEAIFDEANKNLGALLLCCPCFAALFLESHSAIVYSRRVSSVPLTAHWPGTVTAPPPAPYCLCF